MLCTTPTEHLAAKLNTVTGPKCDKMFVTNYFVWFKLIYYTVNCSIFGTDPKQTFDKQIVPTPQIRGLKAAVQDCQNH